MITCKLISIVRYYTICIKQYQINVKHSNNWWVWTISNPQYSTNGQWITRVRVCNVVVMIEQLQHTCRLNLVEVDHQDPLLHTCLQVIHWIVSLQQFVLTMITKLIWFCLELNWNPSYKFDLTSFSQKHSYCQELGKLWTAKSICVWSWNNIGFKKDVIRWTSKNHQEWCTKIHWIFW